MPFPFGTGFNFATKPLPVRRPTALSAVSSYGELFQKDMNGEIRDPTLRLDNTEYVLENGQWILTDVGHVNDDPRNVPLAKNPGINRELLEQFRLRIDTLDKEKNLLILKNEVLLDMLSEVVAEMHLQEADESKR